VQRCGQVEALAAGDGVDRPNLAGGGLATARAAMAVAVGLAVAVGPAVNAVVTVADAVDGRRVAVGHHGTLGLLLAGEFVAHGLGAGRVGAADVPVGKGETE
jgi:ascorbate-specific PTS system EIIC-type component UlaA